MGKKRPPPDYTPAGYHPPKGWIRVWEKRADILAAFDWECPVCHVAIPAGTHHVCGPKEPTPDADR